MLPWQRRDLPENQCLISQTASSVRSLLCMFQEAQGMHFWTKQGMIILNYAW